ncbi:MAG: mechanosensitive ion channel family protein [Bacteroidales bacterium]|nr:mechanosensitive ion channel family protein [Bacteroidales bacterium]
MNRTKKIILAVAAVLCIGLPAWAVFNEKDLPQTLSVLRFELKELNRKMENSRKNLSGVDEAQHARMITMVKKCNELSLILYSQNQDYTFDLTYALNEVSDQYNEFKKDTVPYAQMVTSLNLEIERYEKLIESLKKLPPMLMEYPDSLKDSFLDSGKLHGKYILVDDDDEDEEEEADGHHHHHGHPFELDEKSCEDRDSCIAYAENLLAMYTALRDHIAEDNEHYSNVSMRLKETYAYAQKRYKLVQSKIFFGGQDNYFKVLSNLPFYTKRAFSEAIQKYQRPDEDDSGESSLVALHHMMENHDDDDAICDDCHEGETEEEHEEHVHHHHIHSQWRGPIVLGLVFFVLLYIAISSILTAAIVSICSKKVKALQTERFKSRKTFIALLIGILFFAASVIIANQFIHQNFLVLASGLLLVFAWLVAAIMSSMLVHVRPEQLKPTANIYLPIIVMGLIVIFFRIIFIPNRLINLIYPPLMLGFSIWQFTLCTKLRKKVCSSDYTYSWISSVIFIITTIMCWSGYVLLGIQLIIWWLFQIAAVSTVTAIYDLLDLYEKNVVNKHISKYAQEHTIVQNKRKGAFIEVTWIFDFVKMAIVPVLAILSVPFCIWHAADVFDLTEICKEYFFKPLVNLTSTSGAQILHISIYRVIIVACLFFIFRYAAYAIKALYSHLRLQKAMHASGNDFVHANEVNLTLAHNIIAILCWGSYAIITIIFLKIPMGAISVVAAGLATGIGLALKDVLNNFIYGIQLMSGRLRVGDLIECDGIRGKVDSISYQSTQIITLEDTVMAFTNSALFSKNFKNLTRNSDYELVKIPVGVHYGANVPHVREVLLSALQKLQTVDKYGRNIVDVKKGVTVAFSDFGDSSVDLVVKQYVLVEEEAAYIAKAKEIIYDTLNANNIEIPFPQRDVYIRQMGSEK